MAIIGIDLGTTFSLAAFVTENGADLIKNDTESTFMRSIVSFDGKQIKVGPEAEAIRFEFPKTTYYSFKKFMGRSAKHFENIKLPYEINETERDSILIGSYPFIISPVQASALILKKIKEIAEKILNEKVDKAIITVPAYFEEQQRKATKDAALLASLEPLRIINEPTAAALAYGIDKKGNGNILVYDLGGGTFDVTILKLTDQLFRVLATNGNNALGGDDFDQLLLDYILNDIKLDFNDLSFSQKQQAKVIAEKAKINLTNNLEIEVDLKELHSDKKITLTRVIFNDLIKNLVDQTFSRLEIALQDAKLKKEAIDEIILVGGSTRIPFIRKRVAEYFNKIPNTRIDPDYVVAFGAAIQAANLEGRIPKQLLLDVIPLSLGIETLGGVFSKLIMKNSTVPASVTESFTTAVDNQTTVEINIYQGERELVKDCRLIGKIKLKAIPPMQAGLARVEVTFIVDQNGILQVSAEEKRSGKQTMIEVVPEHGLTAAQVQKMILDSIEFAVTDLNLRKILELKELTKISLHAIEKMWPDIIDLLPQVEINELSELKNSLTAAIDKDDFETLTSGTEKLKILTQPLADKLMSRSILSGLQSMENKN